MNPYALAQYNYFLSDRDRFIFNALNGSGNGNTYQKRKYAKQTKIFVEWKMTQSIEINIHSPHIGTARLSHIKWDVRGATAAYKMLMQLGATKDVRLFVMPNAGVAYVMTKFYFGNDSETNEPLYGDRRYELEDYIEKLIRGHRLKTKKINKLQGAIEKVQSELLRYKKELV